MNAAAAPQPDPAGDWYAIIDSAQDPLLAGLVRQCAGWQCLVGGDLVPELAATMPYLVRWNPDEPLAVAWRTRGVGAHWGILFQSPQTLDVLRTQFKKFLQAMLPDGTTALFRFYDPRVFATYIRAALPAERAPWFRDIAGFAVEGSAPGQIHCFHVQNGRLYDGADAIA